MKPDALVIGAGHNGLVAAARLAQAGRKVLVIEKRGVSGGLCGAREFHPGYKVSGILHETRMLRPLVTESLQLVQAGLRLTSEKAIFSPGEESPVVLPESRGSDRKAILGISHEDSAGLRKWKGFLDAVRAVVEKVVEQPPPPLTPSTLGDFWNLGRQGWAARMLGRRTMLEMLRVAPMSVSDWLADYFESSQLREVLAFPALFGSYVGPRAAGTAANLLLSECLSGRPVEGGPARLVEVLQAACEKNGVQVRLDAEVKEILVRGGRVRGIRLVSGEEIETPVVAASCDPQTTFLKLVHPRHLSLKVEKQFRVWRSRGVAAKVHLALSEYPLFSGLGTERFEEVRIGGGGCNFLEQAFDAVKYGRISDHPALDIRIPSVSNGALAPAGRHVASILVYCAPYHLKGGWTSERRRELKEVVIGRLKEHSPGIEDQIVGCEVLTPADLEANYGVTGGHLCHGEMALDQLLFMRPAPSAARYTTSIEGLYLAGSGSHPGGGVTGLPGFLAAEAIKKT